MLHWWAVREEGRWAWSVGRSFVRIDSFLSAGVAVIFFYTFLFYSHMCMCELASLAHTHTYTDTRTHIHVCTLSHTPLCVAAAAAAANADSGVAAVVYVSLRFFCLCHFDWKIARNWKFLLLAVRSIYSHTHTHICTLPLIHTYSLT